MAKMKEKTLHKMKLKKYHLTDREIFGRYDKLSENELNKQYKKNVYVTNGAITSIIVHCVEVKKKRKKKNRWI